jgi:F-type H+-transporting ATPase subunit delta
VTGISGRYARALFELARDRSALDAVAGDLDRLAAMLDDSADLVRLVRSPVLSRSEQGRAMAAVAERAEFETLTRNFLGLIAQNRRLFALAGMIRDFRRLLASHRGEISGEVFSAHPLNDAQLESIRSQLAKAMGQEVSVTAKVDASLLGGLVVKVGSRMVDSSLKTKLQNIRFAMKGVG